MGLEILIPLVALITTIISVFITWATARYNSRKDKREDTENRMRELSKIESEPLKEILYAHTTRLAQDGDRLGRIEAMQKENGDELRSIAEKLAGIDVKVGFYWEQQAMNAAKQLHQPDPRRAHIDTLLEAFMEGTLTSDERIELKKELVKMRNYEPGQDLGYPVNAVDPTNAAILLGTMDLVNPQRMAVLGHATHRNHTTDEENHA